jgi:hypothetical protein
MKSPLFITVPLHQGGIKGGFVIGFFIFIPLVKGESPEGEGD